MWKKIQQIWQIRSKLRPKPWLAVVFIVCGLGVDFLQGFLDATLIGIIVSLVIELVMIAMVPLCFYLAGVSMANVKQLLFFLGTIAGETLTLAAAPLWVIEICIIIIISWGETALKELAKMALEETKLKKPQTALPKTEAFLKYTELFENAVEQKQAAETLEQ